MSRRLSFSLLVLFAFHAEANTRIKPTSDVKLAPPVLPRTAQSYGRLPLYFEPNQGQVDARVRFLLRASGYTLFLTDDEAVTVVPGKAQVRTKLSGAKKPASVACEEQLPGHSNYFIGNDPDKWRTDIPQCGRVRLQDVYPGIDLVYYQNPRETDTRELEYDFVLKPGADPSSIQLAYSGVDGMKVDRAGDLVLETGAGEMKMRRPQVYQEMDGRRLNVGASYVVRGRKVAFQLARYDSRKALVIDPTLVYSTYLGGTGGGDVAEGVALDSTGSAYIAGYTNSTDFPLQNALQSQGNVNTDAFVSKLSPDGRTLMYSTYIGGGDDASAAEGIAVDSSGAAYISLRTNSLHFPTKGPFQPSLAGGVDAVVLKLSSAGNALVYSSYLGGTGDEIGRVRIALDSTGAAYLTGSTNSHDFPLATPLQPVNRGSGTLTNCFVSKVDPAGSALVYSTYLGGSTSDVPYGIAVDGSGNTLIVGATNSTDFPVVNPTQPTFRGSTSNAFLSKLNSSGSSLVYSTYFGGSGVSVGYGVTVDSSGNAYMTGGTASTDMFKLSPYQSFPGGGYIAKFSPFGTPLFSTYFGPVTTIPLAIALGPGNEIYIAGFTRFPNSGESPTAFPLVKPLQSSGPAAFVAKFDSSATTLLFSTFLGGNTGAVFQDSDAVQAIAIDGSGAYVVGTTYGGFPTANAFQAAFRSTCHPTNSPNFCFGPNGTSAFAAKISDMPDAALTPITVSWGLTTGTGITIPGLISIDGGAPLANTNTTYFVPGSVHTISVVAPLPIASAPNQRAAFRSWSDGGAQSHPITVPNSAAAYKATYVIQGRVPTSVTPFGGGTLSISPPPPPDGYYDEGTQVKFTAIPAAGYQFTGWQGRTGAPNPLTLTMPDAGSMFGTFAPATQPTADSVTPSSGSGPSQTFQFAYTDPNGPSDFALAAAAFNSTLSLVNGCVPVYSRSDNVFYLFNDTGSGPVSGTLAPGATGSLSNSQCTLNGPASVAYTGNTMTLTIPLTFKAPFVGQKNVYLIATSLNGMNSGWQPRGTWSGPVNQPPAILSLSPAAIIGQSKTVTLTVSDPNGPADVSAVYLVMNSTLSFSFGCVVIYSSGTNLLYLVTDSGVDLVPGAITPGDTRTLQNSACTIASGGAVIRTGNSLSLPISITRAPGATVSQTMYASVSDVEGLYSGWQNVGNWTAMNYPPAIPFVGPSLGRGTSQIFRLSYSDPNGPFDLAVMYALVNSSLSTVGGCLIGF